MLLSSIMQEMRFEHYEIYKEKSFENLSYLIHNRVEKERCVFLSENRYLKKIDDSVNMVITTNELLSSVLGRKVGVCVVDNPRDVFYQVHNYLSKKDYYTRNKFKTKIGRNCQISDTAIIANENILIGDRVVIEDKVTLMGHVVIGDDAIIHSGTVIGAAGNDFKLFGDRLIRTAQVGGVKLGKGTEIDQNCCIERSTFPYENTVLGNETKVGALSFVAHGVKIGERTQLKGMVNIAGYTIIGDDVFVGPGATISNLITIGNNAHITIGSVVVSSVLPGKQVTGNFALPHDKFMQQQINILRES